ncbi:MAG: HAMP domain-containing histidine kinase [Actinobacteria bacterium]|nr:HAMP domain-containing histidine kinase [Actinomycetota bacterium]
MFVISNRNTQLLELSQQNKRLALSVEKKNFENPGDALEFLGKTDYLNNIENIIGVKILLADTDMNILINPTDMDNKDLKDLILKSRQINRFFTISDLLTASEQTDLGKMIYAEIDNSKYYISIQEFKTDSQNFLSVFLKQQNEVAIPPLRYIFNLAFIFLIAGLISVLTGLVLGRSISDPILRLNRSVSRISNGDYSEDIQAAGLDEIGVLAQNINIMKNKIERSQESLKEFTYILSHEIKNMITSINGYAVGISEGVYSTEEEINEALNIIRNKSGDLENITESLLMLSKIENRIIDISREEIKITDIVDELVKLYEQELERNRLSITKLYRLPENMKLRSDRYLIQTVISNLINNAIKYSSAESEIVIDISSDTANVIFSVSNRGQEISEDEKDKIFNMFYRSKKYDFKNIKGFGLGLAISRKISSILNAKLDFVSNADVNTFIFKIPLNT